MSKHSKMYKAMGAIFIQNVTPYKSQLTATKATIKNKSQPTITITSDLYKRNDQRPNSKSLF